MLSAVLDTNILASGTITATTPPGQIINAWRDGQFILVTSDHILTELERTLQKPYFQAHLTKAQVKDFIELLQSESIGTPLIAKIENVATHPEDEQRLRLIGKTKKDRLLFIVFTKRGGKIRIISARDVNRKEVPLYEKAT